MLKNVTDLKSDDFGKGLNTNSNILSLEKNQSPNIMDVKVNFDESIEKRLGTNTLNAVVIAQSGGAGFSPDSGNTLKTSIQAFWPLDEDAGNRNDIISTHTLQNGNNVLQAAGIKRYSALFASANSNYLLITNTSTLATGDVDFSMSAWFYLNTTGERTIIAKRDLGTALDASTKLLAHFNGANSSTTLTDISASAHTLTANGSAAINTTFAQFGSGSLDLNGSATANVSITGTTSDFDLQGSDFTFEVFLRPTSNGQVTWYEQMLSDGSNQYLQLYLTQVAGILYPAVDCSSSGTTAFSGSGSIAISTAAWTHLAVVKSNKAVSFYTNGSQNGLITGTGSLAAGTYFVRLGVNLDSSGNPGAQRFLGQLDEFRFSTTPRYMGASFTVPTKEFGSSNDYEYWMYINTDNIVNFRVSSSGAAENATVLATSFGAVSTATWYNAVAWHDSINNNIGISVNLSVTTAAYSSGVRSGSAPFVLGAISNGSSAFMDGRIDETGFWKKVLSAQERSDLYNLGTGNTYQLAFGRDSWGSFDFGATNLRWVVAAAGTGLYASSNLGITWVNIATDRTATYQSFERSKASLIATSDNYDRPLQWAGSAGTFATLLNTSAPLCKYAVNFQGFLILLNSNARKRIFAYEDENTQLTAAWTNNFDLPSSADDEITGSIVLRKNLYVSTRYSLYRVTYIGGNPDWSFKKIKDFGYVPHTMQVISLKDIGEVAVGLDWGRHLRLFDGSDDKIISTDIENDNTMCDFAMEKISYALSGLTISHSMLDKNENVYKLCVAIGADSMATTHMLNFDGRTMAFYPYQNMPFNTMVMAESGKRLFPLAFDRSGYCHIIDSGNLDAGITPINEVYDSPFLFEKSPSAISKSQRIDFYFTRSSAGTLYYQERVDFSAIFKPRDQFTITNDTTKVQIKKPIDIPQTAGVYQYRLTTSAGTADPWILNRTDYFLHGLGIGDSK